LSTEKRLLLFNQKYVSIPVKPMSTGEVMVIVASSLLIGIALISYW